MNIENIELSDYEREVLDYERELLDKAVKKSNQNFKFIINFLRKKQDALKKEELWKISQILKEYSFSSFPVIMSEIMVEIMIEEIISFVAGYAYLECLESGKNFQDFFENYYFIFKELRETDNIREKIGEYLKKIQKFESKDIFKTLEYKGKDIENSNDVVFWCPRRSFEHFNIFYNITEYKVMEKRFGIKEIKLPKAKLVDDEMVLLSAKMISKNLDKKIKKFFQLETKAIKIKAEDFHNLILSIIKGKRISATEKEKIKNCYYLRRQSFLNELSKNMKKYNFSFSRQGTDCFIFCPKNFFNTNYSEKAFIGAWRLSPLASSGVLERKLEEGNIKAEFVNLK